MINSDNTDDKTRRPSETIATTDPEGGRPLFLNGWKEIASYLGRGVRTVQRWEALGLPVRRPNSRLRSAVLSTTQEIDTWLQQCGDGRNKVLARALQEAPADAYSALLQQVIALRGQLEQLRAENKALRQKLDMFQSVGGGREREASNNAA